MLPLFDDRPRCPGITIAWKVHEAQLVAYLIEVDRLSATLHTTHTHTERERERERETKTYELENRAPQQREKS